MNKCICDFCKTNEADRRYKVKRKFLQGFHDTDTYTKVDICTDCYIKLFIKKKLDEIKNSENMKLQLNSIYGKQYIDTDMVCGGGAK